MKGHVRVGLNRDARARAVDLIPCPGEAVAPDRERRSGGGVDGEARAADCVARAGADRDPVPRVNESSFRRPQGKVAALLKLTDGSAGVIDGISEAP